MSDLLCFATIALAGFTQACLQLSFGGLILLYHSSMGRHRRRKTRGLATSYILGVMILSFLAVSGAAFWISQVASGGLSLEIMLICVGVFLASAVVMWALYFRWGDHTELWLPRSISRFISRKAKHCNDRVEAFSLGLLGAFAETPMSLALFFLVGNCLVTVSANLQVLALFSYLVIASAPLLILKGAIKNGSTAVAAQKWRIKHKMFARFVSSASFLVLSAFVLAFWVY